MAATTPVSTDANKNAYGQVIIANGYLMPTAGAPVVPGSVQGAPASPLTLAQIIASNTQVWVIGQVPANAQGGVNRQCFDAEIVRVDPSGGTLTVFFPQLPYDGMRVTVKDSTGSSSANNITVKPFSGSSSHIERTDAIGSYNTAAAGTLIGTNGQSVTWAYNQHLDHWEIVSMVPS